MWKKNHILLYHNIIFAKNIIIFAKMKKNAYSGPCYGHVTSILGQTLQSTYDHLCSGGASLWQTWAAQVKTTR
jgi:hypothetical protein